jgi:DNA invertase Pin-like site-specific DNA recombinase
MRVLTILPGMSTNVEMIRKLRRGIRSGRFPQANRFTIHIMAAVAEHEARMVSERPRAALKSAHARGIKPGGFEGVPIQRPIVLRLGRQGPRPAEARPPILGQ